MQTREKIIQECEVELWEQDCMMIPGPRTTYVTLPGAQKSIEMETWRYELLLVSTHDKTPHVCKAEDR